MIVRIIEMYKSNTIDEIVDMTECEDYNGGTIVSISEVISTLPGNPEVAVITMSVDIGDMDKMSFIKAIAADASNAFIVIAPTEEQEIIVDFTLSTDNYFKILEAEKDIIETKVASRSNDQKKSSMGKRRN